MRTITKLSRSRTRPVAELLSRPASLANVALPVLRERLRIELAQQHLNELPGHLIAQALRDADSVAALNPYPQLVLPVLAEEKVQAAKVWHQRQQQILEKTSLTLAE
jgi:uncharacterized protein (DUF2267 family)